MNIKTFGEKSMKKLISFVRGFTFFPSDSPYTHSGRNKHLLGLLCLKFGLTNLKRDPLHGNFENLKFSCKEYTYRQVSLLHQNHPPLN